MQAAKELLAGEEDLQAIHSAKSVAAMLESAKNKVNLPVVKSTEDARIVNQPVVVTHEPSEGSRLDPVAKNTVSNLPYMHRSPSV